MRILYLGSSNRNKSSDNLATFLILITRGEIQTDKEVDILMGD